MAGVEILYAVAPLPADGWIGSALEMFRVARIETLNWQRTGAPAAVFIDPRIRQEDETEYESVVEANGQLVRVRLPLDWQWGRAHPANLLTDIKRRLKQESQPPPRWFLDVELIAYLFGKFSFEDGGGPRISEAQIAELLAKPKKLVKRIRAEGEATRRGLMAEYGSEGLDLADFARRAFGALADRVEGRRRMTPRYEPPPDYFAEERAIYKRLFANDPCAAEIAEMLAGAVDELAPNEVRREGWIFEQYRRAAVQPMHWRGRTSTRIRDDEDAAFNRQLRDGHVWWEPTLAPRFETSHMDLRMAEVDQRPGSVQRCDTATASSQLLTEIVRALVLARGALPIAARILADPVGQYFYPWPDGARAALGVNELRRWSPRAWLCWEERLRHWLANYPEIGAAVRSVSPSVDVPMVHPIGHGLPWQVPNMWPATSTPVTRTSRLILPPRGLPNRSPVLSMPGLDRGNCPKMTATNHEAKPPVSPESGRLDSAGLLGANDAQPPDFFGAHHVPKSP